MNSSKYFDFLSAPIAESKVHLTKVRRSSGLSKFCLCLLGILGFSFHVFATLPVSTENNAAADTVTKHATDWSKVPPVTPMPRPGMFVMPPPGPGYYSLWDQITGKERATPPVSPYPPFALLPTSAFDIDFRYLENPEHEKDFFDPVKRMHLADDWLLSFGGSFWYRYMRETDSRLNAAGKNNDYNLIRTRVHADLWYRDQFRLFAEFLDARSFSPELNPLAIDRNHTDMLNLFADVKLGNIQNAPAYIRFGRQELLYGSQRLISTLDWANTRRTFQGVKTFWRSEKLDVDAFWVRPMDTSKGDFDNWDQQRNFFGLWGAYKPMRGQLLDLYFLSLDDNRNVSAANLLQANILQGNSTVHTLGGRFVGDYNRYLYEIEGMYQFGQRSNLDISAFAVATGVGYHFQLPMNPQIWARYDFASGDNNQQDGRSNTFNHLFPFGHYYMGYMDQVGRQNIHDFNAQMTLHPKNWFTFIAQYHRYYLANKRDYLYNAGGIAILRDATGQSGSHVGDEIDFRTNFHVSRHQDILVGYSKLFTGNFIENQRPGISPDLFYVQYNFRF
ncbi:MAG: alginate export family protein [Nitrosomonas sp.]|nr:alginate export family protein [Nitrosomonas sp.]MDP1950132.1 alginate export family protein [Nitrosomonas sp.]